MREVKDHVDKELASIARGKRHHTPEKENDVRMLMNAYIQDGVYKFCSGRESASSEDKLNDVLNEGLAKVHSGKSLKSWWNARLKTRRTTDIYVDEEDEEDELIETVNEPQSDEN